jgi:EAL domain-containing protein (putative c-di-GMP-specific phosphodiesterase class I)
MPFLPAEVGERLEPHLPRLVAEVHDRLGSRRELSDVLDRLTRGEHDDLQARQVEHLRQLLEPRVDAGSLRQRARGDGRAYSMSSIELDWYVDGVAEHRRALFAAIDEHCADLDPGAVKGAMGDRLIADLHGGMLGFRDVDEAQSMVLLEVLEVAARAATITDLARELVEALGRLPGVAVVLFARPGHDGEMQPEAGAGPGLDAFLAAGASGEYASVSTDPSSLSGNGPIGRAWRSGHVERCDSLKLDPTTQPWRGIVDLLGWGSSAAVPLVDRSGRSRALISLQAWWTGYFASESRASLLDQVKRAVERALVDLEHRPALSSGVSGLADRSHHLSLLASRQVEMLFQPVVSLPDGEVVKLEALARLRDRDRLVSPAEFLPAFGDEEMFRLFDIGLDQALTALCEWEADGLETSVSLNLPVVSLLDDRYERLVAERLASYDVAPARLTLELLESGFVDREVHVRRRSFDVLTRLGVRFAQDDLGSGYSSLLRLRHFAFDEVKIDQSLVRGTELAPGAALHFITPISDLAHSLGIDVVIEGLEDDGLIEAATLLGVDAGQGYGIARPMPRRDVVGWTASHRLHVDRAHPRTLTGALAGHVAWEHAVRGASPPTDSCVLTGYLARVGCAEVARIHEDVHTQAVAGRGSAVHRAGWQRLLDALDAG